MVNKSIQMCSIFVSLGNFKLRHEILLYNLFRIADILNTDKTKCCQEGGATMPLIYCWWECKAIQPFWKTTQDYIPKLNIHTI